MGLVRLIIKGFFYIAIVIPLVRTIVASFIPWGWMSWLLGMVAALGVAFWLESSGLSNKLLSAVFNPNKSVKKTLGEGMSSLFESGDASPKGTETSMTCPNCGTQVTLLGGRGKCRACDTAF